MAPTPYGSDGSPARGDGRRLSHRPVLDRWDLTEQRLLRTSPARAGPGPHGRSRRLCERRVVDPVTQAAVAHAQFETIHPYGDGNGRIGRILIGWILAHRTGINVPPPISVFIARDPGGYLAGLTRFRLGELDPWVDWLAGELRYSSEAAQGLMLRSEQLLKEWNGRIDDLRADATARLVLPVLIEHPVVSSDQVAERVAVSERAAGTALTLLAERGILEPYNKAPAGPGRPRRFWVASELIAMVTTWGPL